jgi:hypothetical protein
VLTLLDAGVPWDVIMSFSPAEVHGWCVAAGEIRGRKWSWSRMEWQRPDE